MPDPLAAISTRQTPQREQADPRQVRNSAGGFGFSIGDHARMRRFLVLGTEGGTFYASERELTKENAQVVLTFARERPRDLLTELLAISRAGRAPRNNPALFALAAAASLAPELSDRWYALELLPEVARTATHLFTFTGYVRQFRGWGRGLRRSVSRWYDRLDDADLAYQACKYRQRDGWTHRDVLRLAHPAHRDLYAWIVGKTDADFTVDQWPIVDSYVRAQAATTVKEWVKLISENRSLSWEMLPDAALKEAAVWEALIAHGMPQTALMRKLPQITSSGALKPGSLLATYVAARLSSPEQMTRARVHPIAVLLALRTYASGKSMKGKSTWTPNAEVIDGLDAGFYAAFGAIEPAGKRTMLAIDVSGSMGWTAEQRGRSFGVQTFPGTPRELSAAMAMVTLKTEPAAFVMGFSRELVPLPVTPRQRLDDAVRAVSSVPMGGTDCALPMVWALKNKVPVDHFSVYTDNETWYGHIHPHQALESYRQGMGINAKLSVIGMTATDFSIADPADERTMDVAGFDSAVPSLLADFARADV